MKAKIIFLAITLAIFITSLPSLAQSTEPIYQPDFSWTASSKMDHSNYPYKIQIVSLKTNLDIIDSEYDWRKPFYQKLTTTNFKAQINEDLRIFFKNKGFDVVEKGYEGKDTIKIGLYINWIMTGFSVSSNGPVRSTTGQLYFPIPLKEEHSFKFAIYDFQKGIGSKSMSPFDTGGMAGGLTNDTDYLVYFPKQVVEYSKAKFCGGFMKSVAMVGMSNVESIGLNPYFYNTNIKILEGQAKNYFNYLWQHWTTQDMGKWLPDPERGMKAPQKPIDAD